MFEDADKLASAYLRGHAGSGCGPCARVRADLRAAEEAGAVTTAARIRMAMELVCSAGRRTAGS